MLAIGNLEHSRYIRTTWMISAEAALQVADLSKVRFLGADEAETLAEQVRRRNVFARHSRENNFYVQRAKEVGRHTIIEVFRPGDPKGMGDEAERVASAIEKLTVLSSTLALNKSGLQQKLGIRLQPRTETSFIVGADFRFLRSRASPTPAVQGIRMDETFCKRFSRCGFDALGVCMESKSDVANRVLSSLDWLFDSRIEPRLVSSVVKTSIALEPLLILSESESLAQTLSERAAFILSSEPGRRLLISRILKRFYDARSGVVHGSQKKAKKLTPSLLETVDRLTILLCLVIAANAKVWPSSNALREWCETQRWGAPSNEIKIPFPDLYLRNALLSGQKELEQKL